MAPRLEDFPGRDLPGRTRVFTISVASVLWSTGLLLTLWQATNSTHAYEMSETQAIVHAALSVALKWRTVVLAAELCGLYSTLANYAPGLKVWAIAVGADWTGQLLLVSLGFLLRFHSQLAQPFGDLLCSELTRGEFFRTATVETCEETWEQTVTCALALFAAYLAVKLVTVGIIFSHFTQLRAALAKAEDDDWAQLMEIKSDGRARSVSFRRRSSSSSSYHSLRQHRADSLPTYASVEAGHPPGLGRTISGRRKSHTISSGSHSSAPRLVLVPVFYDGRSHSRSASTSSSSTSPDSPYAHRPPPSYAHSHPPFSPDSTFARGRAASAGAASGASLPSRQWDQANLGALGTRRLSFATPNGTVHVASGRGSASSISGADLPPLVAEPDPMDSLELAAVKA